MRSFPGKRYGWLASLLVLSLFASTLAAAGGAPWRRRRRPGVRPNRMATVRVLPSDWPAEPQSPGWVDKDRLADAIEKLCGWLPKNREARFARSTLEHAAEFEVDPFLLGALIHRMGRCRPDREELSGLGLTLLVPGMYRRYLRHGVYRYWVQDGEGAWQEKSLSVSRYPFSSVRLKRTDENLYFTAAMLAAWRDQHISVDHVFEQVPHRHYISHFVWGDRVPSDRAEDRILLDRRRLLYYYGTIDAMAPRRFKGLTIGAPLDGGPRVVSSFVGAERDGGDRHHRGIDIESDMREPVRAIADGKVTFAGVDLPGRQNHENMTAEEIAEVPRRDLAAGGRYVCLLHDPSEMPWLRSCYMHLEDVEVIHGSTVRRGQRIGTVGRTGMHVSAPHLHFELQGPDGIIDPRPVLDGFVLGRKVIP